jgi:dihydroorotate dehydrogenase electron transfer subunit
MGLQTSGIVIENRKIKPSYFLLEIHCPPIATKIKPGQFIMLKVSDDNHPFLRRPFSVYKSYPDNHPGNKKKGSLSILYKMVGKGTHKMTRFEEGQRVDMIGPLGNGFTLPPYPFSTNIILVGGGVGIVSLYALAEVLAGGKLFVFIGGKTWNDILCSADFKKLNSNIFIATEDGSLGLKGTVIDLFLSQRKKFKRDESNHLYACGPIGMLKDLTRAIRFEQFVCQASFESRMGCGFGACWGCVVKTSDPKTPYQRVCKEGPVFNLKDIVWE